MNCPNCRTPLLGGLTVCPKCKYDTTKKNGGKIYLDIQNKKQQEREEIEAAYAEYHDNYGKFMQTTGIGFDGYFITKYLGIKSGEVVLGTGFLSEFSASISDYWGVQSTAMANKLTKAKEAAMTKLIGNCVKVGANAVIGVNITLSTLGDNMIIACANGTAVRIEED